MRRQNLFPWGAFGSTHAEPSCAVAILFTIANPKPRPRFLPFSNCVRRSNTAIRRYLSAFERSVLALVLRSRLNFAAIQDADNNIIPKIISQLIGLNIRCVIFSLLEGQPLICIKAGEC